MITQRSRSLRSRLRGDRRMTHLPTLGVAALVALTVWGLADAHPARLALDIVVGVAAMVTVPLMRRWPVAAALAATALAALSPAATPPATFGVLVVAQRRRFAVAVAVGLTGVAAHAVLGWWRPSGGLSYQWWLILVTVAYGALIGWGQLAQARWALLASLRERARRAEADQAARVAEARAQERSRIAREMHDVLAHRLSLVATYAGALEYRPDAAPEQVARAAGVVRTGVTQALAELREVIGVLRGPPERATRPQPAYADLPRLVAEARAAGQTVTYTDLIEGDPPADSLARTAFRVVQEGLTNARRHAPGAAVTIVLSGAPGGSLDISLTNPARPTPSTVDGLGLTGLAERVELAGGRLDAGADSGEFRLLAHIPWPA